MIFIKSDGQDEFCQVNVKDYGFTYLEVRSTLTRKYNDLPRVTLLIFNLFSFDTTIIYHDYLTIVVRSSSLMGFCFCLIYDFLSLHYA